MDRLARREIEAVTPDAGRLRRKRNKMHLDAPERGIEIRMMGEPLAAEIAAEFPVDPVQQIEVEGRGHAARIVVGGMQPGRRLDQVGANQHAVRLAACARQEGARFTRRQVADGRAWKINHAPSPRTQRREADPVRKVANHGRDAQPGKVVAEARRCPRERAFGDIDRHVGGGPQGADQQPGLEAGAAAVLDEFPAPPREVRDGVEMLPRQRQFRARQVILGERTDALEQAATRGIVKIFRRQGLLRPGKTRDDV